MESDGGRRRRRLTVADHMSVLDSSSLRDLLNVRDDNCGDSLRGLTLGAVLGCEERRLGTVTVNRTLFDIIRDEKSGISCRGHVGPNNKKSWKFFKDRLRRTTAAWAPSSSTLEDCRIQISPPIPAPPVTSNSVPTTPAVTTNAPARSDETILAINQPENETTSATAPVITRLAAALAAERELQQPRQGSERNGSNSDAVGEGGREASAASVEEAEAGVEGAPIRMSLMALLEETDRQAGVVGSGLLGTAVEERGSGLLGTAVEEGEEGKEGGQEGGEYVCCVCMVRHKGAAFIPCGHTFCRLCCRELWVSRGNCPLCNGFILEILDIF